MSDAATIVSEVKAFYSAYIEAFNREDAGVYLQSFSYPNAVLRGERGMKVHSTESDQKRYYKDLLLTIKGEGWDHTEVGQMQVAPLTDISAILVADFARCKKDNTPIEYARLCYTLRRDHGAWKILTLTDVKPPFMDPGAW